VGGAFDYLLRFEIQRRAPHSVGRSWAAEASAAILSLTNGIVFAGSSALNGQGPEHKLRPEEIAKRAHGIVQEARAAVDSFCRRNVSDTGALKELAAHALRLAKLDIVLRARLLDPTFDRAEEEDIEDLISMISIAPVDNLLSADAIFLNPTFGSTGRILGGADADLISGGTLIDFKVTKKLSMEAQWLDQLLGYFLLWRKERSKTPALPEIRRAGFLFARHGHLWTFDASAWTEHPDFLRIERWFFKTAKELRLSEPRATSTAAGGVKD